MGFFGRLFGKGAPDGTSPPAQPDAAPDVDPEPPSHVIALREGMSTPSAEDVAAIVRQLAPEHADLPARGLAQPRWWRQDDWVAGGLRGIGTALADELAIDPDETTWELGRDPQGARIAVIVLRPRGPVA